MTIRSRIADLFWSANQPLAVVLLPAALGLLVRATVRLASYAALVVVLGWGGVGLVVVDVAVWMVMR